jgi:hypothetical protein
MPVRGKAVIIGGGTVYHVRPHLALSAPAYGATARAMEGNLLALGWDLEVYLTKMAGGRTLETNADIQNLIEKQIIPDTDVKLLIMNAALCDFEGNVIHPYDVTAPMPIEDSGKDQPRLKTSGGTHYLALQPAAKVISLIRKERKDIFLVGFKTTAGATREAQYLEGLELLKKSSCNLVLANDVHTRKQMIITPEQAIYGENVSRSNALVQLAEMATSRANLKFTRSTVVEGSPVAWASPEVPEALRVVVDHMIARGAYKPFLGKTVGHFAVKVGEGQFLTSIRKTNFNELDKTGLVRVESQDDDHVIAYGARPSVGGQSQRIIFREHGGVDCIFHAHIPLRENPADDIPVRPQWGVECGSHQCGANTSEGLKDFGGIKAVMLDQHGPNVVFRRDTDPEQVIRFIEANFDPEKSTDGILTSVG